MRLRLAAFWFATAMLTALLSPSPLFAQAQPAEVGRVIVAVGQFTARQPGGQTRALARRSPVLRGDLLITGENAQGQIRFSDGSLVALHSASEFRVDDYRFDGTPDGDENAAFTLIKGGMRTITGVVGKANKDRYKLSTDSATIGIRGTHYLLVRCTADCGDLGAGLYGGVVQGTIAVSNASGGTDVSDGQYFFVKNESTPLQFLLTPPGLLFSGETRAPGKATDGQGDMAGFGAHEAGPAMLERTAPLATADPVLTPDTHLIDPAPTHQAAFVSAPVGAVFGVAFIKRTGVDEYEDTGISFRQGQGTSAGNTDVRLGTVEGVPDVPLLGEVYLPALLDQPMPGCSPCTFLTTQGSLSDAGGVGGDGMGINWGRWAGGYAVTENGVVDDSVGSFHYIYSPNETPYSTVLGMKGAYTYSLIGGTSPTDETGAVGNLSSATVAVDFGTQEITGVSLAGSVGEKTFSASQIAALPLAQAYQPGGGVDLTGSCVGGSCGGNGALSGRMSVNFVGPNAERIMSVYGLTAGSPVGAGVTLPAGITGTAALAR